MSPKARTERSVWAFWVTVLGYNWGVTIEDLPHYRLHNQKIGGCKSGVHSLVAYMGAMQAQDYYGALWSIGLRTGKTEEEVIDSIEKAEIIRTWPQRGTLHYVAAEDAKWMVDLSAPRLIASAKRRHADLGLDAKTLERSKELFGDALKVKRRLTRPQMMDVLEDAGISTKNGRGYHMLWNAAQTGLTYLGPMQGKQQTFGLLEDLTVESKQLNGAEAVAELAKRYFVSHGPATIHDFVGWSGVTMTQARASLDANKSELVCEKLESAEYWLTPHLCRPPKAPETALLPGFDEYILGYKDRSAQVTTANFKRLAPGGNGMFMSSIVRNGQLVGLWKRVLKKGRVAIALEPFDRFTPQEIEAIEVAAKSYGEFLGLQIEMKS